MPLVRSLKRDPNGGWKPTNLPEPLASWSGAFGDYPRMSVDKLFEYVVSMNADRVAIVGPDCQLTYRELNMKANQLAHRLRSMGVGLETPVGCCLERSAAQVVALLAILKAGGAYVPMDPGYPAERIRLILDDTQAPFVITQANLTCLINAIPEDRRVMLDSGGSVHSMCAEDPAPLACPRSLAYIMYTSGSTGRPKGVMVEHRSIVRLVKNTNYCRFDPEEVFLQYAPVSFDASTFEIWGPLLNGAKLVIMPPQAASLDQIGSVIRKHGVTTLWLTSGLFHLMVEQRLEDLRPLRQLLAGGDVLHPRAVQKVLDEIPACTVINGYGPTENTTFTCCHVMRHGDHVGETTPIGRPITNSKVYLLNDKYEPVAPGQAGELYAGGDGVARGYWNRPDLTSENFLEDPFSGESGARMYRTGDLASWLPDGTISFIGRIDSQVKVRGYRIEPGEVESVLLSHPDVTQACVVGHTRHDGEKQLAAYVAGTSDMSGLRTFLRRQIPEHMIPAHLVAISEFKLNPNGKIDRHALPEPPSFATASADHTGIPSNDIEAIVVDLWKRELKVGSVGVSDNFFDVGGDSLRLVAVHAQLQSKLRREIPVTALFEYATIRTLAGYLSGEVFQGSTTPDGSDRANQQRAAFVRFRQRVSKSKTE